MSPMATPSASTVGIAIASRTFGSGTETTNRKSKPSASFIPNTHSAFMSIRHRTVAHRPITEPIDRSIFPVTITSPAASVRMP